MKNVWITLRLLSFLTLVTGVLYPASVTLVGKLFFPWQVGGSLVYEKKTQAVIGSALLAQGFTSPQYFWPRPSSVNYVGSGGSNLSVTSKSLQNQVKSRESAGLVGALRLSSASGLDPHIDPESALSQARRVARERGLTDLESKKLIELVRSHIEPPQFGFLGEARVNVLLLNQDLDKRFSVKLDLQVFSRCQST